MRRAWVATLGAWLIVSGLSVGFLLHWHHRERHVVEDQAYSLVHALANTLRTMSGAVLRSEVGLKEVFEEIAATPSIDGIALVTPGEGLVAGVGIAAQSLAAAGEAPKGALFRDHDILVWDTVDVGACVRPGQGRYGWRRERDNPLAALRPGTSVEARLLVSQPLAWRQARWRRDEVAVGVFCVVALGAAVGMVRLWGVTRRSAEYAIRLRLAAEETRALREMNLVAAGLAHEIKNPLSTMRGMAQRLAAHPGDAQATACAADAIVQEIDRVSNRINELLLFAKPRAPELSAVPLGELFTELRDWLAEELSDAGLEVRGPDARVVVRADREQLRQVLFNLFHNAIRFAPHSGALEVLVGSAADGTLTLTVRDHGPGVPAAAREEVFAPYYTTAPEGSGLGLAIVRRICQAHGWRVTCLESEGGAAFQITGIAPASTPAAPPVGSPV